MARRTSTRKRSRDTRSSSIASAKAHDAATPRLSPVKACVKSSATSRQTTMPQATAARIESLMTRIRRSAERSSATTRSCSSPSVSGQRAINTRERSTTRDSRPARTLSKLPVATSKNTGVTDNWIVWAIALASKSCTRGSVPARSDRRRVDAVHRQEFADVARGLTDALLILHHRNAHKAFAVLAIADARCNRDLGMGQQLL